MTTANYLQQIWRLDRMIINKMLEIENLESKATNMVAPTDKENVKSSGSQDKMACLAILAAEESKKVDFLKAKRNKIVSQIDNLDNTTYYDILTMYYVLNYSLKSIGDTLGYSQSSIKSMKVRAMRYFESQYGKTYLSKK